MMERKFNVDLSQRPAVNARKLEAFQQLIEQYPHSQYAGGLEAGMIYLRNRWPTSTACRPYYMTARPYVRAINRAKFASRTIFFFFFFFSRRPA